MIRRKWWLEILVPAFFFGCSSSSGTSGAGWSNDGGGSTDGAASPESSMPEATAPDGGTATDAAPMADGSASDGSGTGTDAGSTGDSGAGEAGTMQTVEMTFYGWDDNSPPGNAIAYPKNGGFPTIHDAAGGTGTYADPITYATDKSELPIGTIVYAPVIEKYLVMEDDCGQCDTDWSGSMMWHIDVWMNSDGTESASALTACEDQWTQSMTTIEINPPPGRMVTTSPLFAPSTDTCRTTP
jgi:3D (Asp-Asp-Asp) domain-containing protein